MAIFCLNVRNIRRGQGRSQVGAAAYCSRTRLHDERSGYSYDFTGLSGDRIHSEVIIPADGIFDQSAGRGQIWNTCDAVNERDNALLGWEIEAVMPGELHNSEAVHAAQEFAAESLSGMFAVDLNLHRACCADGGVRIFAYFLVYVVESLGDPVFPDRPPWVGYDRLKKWRKGWAKSVNRRVMAAGSSALIDIVPGAARGRSLELDVAVEGLAAVELRWRNGERINAEPELAVRHLLRDRDGFRHAELVSLVRELTASEAQFKKVLRRVESLPGIVRTGKSESGEDLFGFRAPPPGGELKLHGVAEPAPSPPLAARSPSGGGDDFAPLRAAAAEWVKAGLRARGVGLTYDLAKRFEKATGIQTSGVHGILGRWKKKKDLLEPGDVLVVNDAAQLSDPQKEWMLKAVRRAKAKMAVVTARGFVLIDGNEIGLDERQSGALCWSGV